MSPSLPANRIVISTVLLLLCLPVLVQAAQQTLRFGVVPQQSAHKLAQHWLPLLDALEKHSGLKLQFETAPNIPAFEERLSQSEYDIAYMNPYHYTVFSRSPGYRAIAKAKYKRIKGILVVHKDSPIQSIQELNSKTLAFPAPAAFAASVLIRAELSRQGIQFEPNYVQTHDSVYLTVARQLFPAGGGVMRTYRSMPDKIASQIRILWTTPGFTPHAIAVNPNMSPEKKNRIQQALLELDTFPEGKVALNTLNINGFDKALNADWDDVRALNIDMLNSSVKEQTNP
ncbi:MAG: phosphate ABC transporter substrate-binding protein [Kangiellaceae bacterium]|nr:phosphate ABC transporter substrate-binding protein [Kangiellaceae bacterium]|tara:strand:- start:6080 stop:6937 length:858 start_codon:yes stop_codon:yes gene_type:complete